MATAERTEAQTLEPKAKVIGTVLKTTLAGAILDIGHELPGVVHISQLRREPVNKVEDILHEGQRVDAWVRRVRSDRVELTMIEPLLLDWRDIQPDMVVKGRVTRIEAYGAFVDFGAERPGLVHVSELSHGYVKSAAQAVREGQEVEAKVLEVDRKKRQIRLSLKALQPEPEPEKPERDERRQRRDCSPREEREEPPAPPAPQPQPEPELTDMQVAWQEALGKSKSGAKPRRQKPRKTRSKEQEEILNRTLEHRLPTGN